MAFNNVFSVTNETTQYTTLFESILLLVMFIQVVIIFVLDINSSCMCDVILIDDQQFVTYEIVNR